MGTGAMKGTKERAEQEADERKAPSLSLFHC